MVIKINNQFVFSHAGFQPTTLGAEGSAMITALTNRVVCSSLLVCKKPDCVYFFI